MAFPGTGKIWMNGTFVDWKDANVHIASHVIHYASGVFEGARCYKTVNGPACFRLDAHMRRLVESARVYRMEPRFSQAALTEAVLETIRVNKLEHCYIRPLIYRGYDSLGVFAANCPIDTAILVWEWGTYFSSEALEQGLDVKVSTWNRMAPNTLPAMAKCVANYANSQLIAMEARLEGYAEGLALDTEGNVSEGSGQNVFVVRDGIIYTPGLASSVLWGITRDSAMTIAQDLGYEVREQVLPREMLYLADEVFFVGTAVEITPIRSVDRITIGKGSRGPITAAIQKRFQDVVSGRHPDTHGWLTFVNTPAGVTTH